MCISNVKVAPVQRIRPDEPRLQMRMLKRLDGTWEYGSVQFNAEGNVENVDTAFNGFQPKGNNPRQLYLNSARAIEDAVNRQFLTEIE